MVFAFFYKYNGALPNYILNEKKEVSLAKMQAYHIGEVSVSRFFWKKRLSVTLGCKNMFNVRYVLGSNSQSAHSAGGNQLAVGTGRTYFLSLDIQLKSKR